MEESRKCILIIEDEVGISELLSYALRREGYKTIAEFSGNGGIYKLNSEKIDLLLLDLMLPDINGIDICKKVKSEYKIPVIIITAKSDIVYKVTGFSFGADDYITKPFDVREIITRVNAAFRRIEEIEEKKAECSTYKNKTKYSHLHGRTQSNKRRTGNSINAKGV
ncbi:response regulator [Acetivibrio clariflavus]|uniref:response regulator n=1 Tax=Acetivibrio clariflavus TaxID=288965 RepID=UPI0031F4B752